MTPNTRASFVFSGFYFEMQSSNTLGLHFDDSGFDGIMKEAQRGLFSTRFPVRHEYSNSENNYDDNYCG